MSRIAAEWLQKHSSKFRHFHWPPQSPDMSIIERILDVCNVLFRRYLHPLLLLPIYGQPCKFHGVIYFQILLQILVESMPCRFAALLCASGDRTQY
ncbi:DDE_3 domain-containing protein [Trichonephila clavipes]|nr:DDE_3 domain-containing protein [Trichonephila clavipes]